MFLGTIVIRFGLYKILIIIAHNILHLTHCGYCGTFSEVIAMQPYLRNILGTYSLQLQRIRAVKCVIYVRYRIQVHVLRQWKFETYYNSVVKRSVRVRFRLNNIILYTLGRKNVERNWNREVIESLKRYSTDLYMFLRSRKDTRAFSKSFSSCKCALCTKSNTQFLLSYVVCVSTFRFRISYSYTNDD